jgi:hypothetical protein
VARWIRVVFAGSAETLEAGSQRGDAVEFGGNPQTSSDVGADADGSAKGREKSSLTTGTTSYAAARIP